MINLRHSKNSLIYLPEFEIIKNLTYSAFNMVEGIRFLSVFKRLEFANTASCPFPKKLLNELQ